MRMLILFLVAASAGGQESVPFRPAAAAPRVVIPEPTHDFGRQPQFTKLDHDFVIRNEGDADLEIKSVRATCQCQAAMPDKRLLKPGESTVIKTSFDTKTMSGSVHKPIVVETNDPARPNLQLMIKVHILPPYWVEPAELNLGSITKNDIGEPMEFSVVLAPSARLDITQVKTTTDLLQVERLDQEPREREDHTRQIRYRVHLKPGLPVGIVREQVIIDTDLQAKRSATLGVSAEIVGEVKVSPRTFRIPTMRRGQTTSRTVDVIKTGEANLEIKSCALKPESAAEAFDVELVTEEEGRHYKVKVTLKPDAPPRYHRARVIILTNCPGEELHQAYFYATVR